MHPSRNAPSSVDARRGSNGSRPFHHHNRHGSHDNHRRFQRGGGRGGRGFGHHSHSVNSTTRGSFWFKGDGYNDFENVSIDEEVVGIHGFLTREQPGFPGLVKQRYSDFIVHEIANDGEHVALTALVAKKRTIQAAFMELVSGFTYSSEHESSSSPVAVETHGLIRSLAKDVAQRATARSLVGQEALEEYSLRKLVHHVTRELGDKMGAEFASFLAKIKARKEARAAGTVEDLAVESEPLEFYISGFNDKSDRVFIHETMRRYGKSLIVADTITSPDMRQVIRIRQLTENTLRKGERDPRKEWPVDRPDYLQFVVYKRNKDILAVVNQLSSMLKVQPTQFTYAEAKDKRGITSQLCTVYRVAKEKFQVFARQTQTRGLDDQSYIVGNLKYSRNKLKLGDCRGNVFTIVVRGIPDAQELSEHVVDEAVDTWHRRGFVNYFGIQRFGNSATPHHVLGRALLRKDFKLAVLLLLRPQEGEASKVRQAREHFRQHKDVAAALRMLPPFLIPERAVLEGLLQHGMEANELAFRNIPAHLRVAYVEAYQFYVWNQMASLRIDTHGASKPVVGDLVFADSEKKTVVALTEETVGQYAITDVVLPLPGFQVVYPANEIGVAYEKMLGMDSVDLASWESVTQSANHHPYDVKGSYRFVVAMPQHVRFELREYADATQPLVLSDVDLVQGRTAPPPAQEKRPASSSSISAASAPHEAETKPVSGRALVLHFQLDYGSDATVALRELLKQSSSTHSHWQSSDAKESVVNHSTPQPTSVAMTTGEATILGKKRPATTSLTGSKPKDAKVAAAKKSQVAIGRPGFSLGKC